MYGVVDQKGIPLTFN